MNTTVENPEESFAASVTASAVHNIATTISVSSRSDRREIKKKASSKGKNEEPAEEHMKSETHERIQTDASLQTLKCRVERTGAACALDVSNQVFKLGLDTEEALN
jgi:hypothetical protein